MNREQLLGAFDRLGDTPETIAQFRKLVVGLAIAGKLSSTAIDDTLASQILETIQQTKRSSMKISRSLAVKPWPKVTAEDLPAGFPSADQFVRLGSVARIEKGSTGIKDAVPGSFPLVVTAEGRLTCDHFDFDGAAAIVPLVSSAGHGKASLQRLHYQEGQFALGTILAAIFPHAPDLMSARFIFEYLTAFKDELLVSRMIGTANVSLSIGKVAEVPVPLIAPSVQAKVDELMALCDRLEAARAEREAKRDRLATASLARLNAPDPETFQADTRFALGALPALTTRPDQIKALRQTILNLAVRGKLVEQNPNDEPAMHFIRVASRKKTNNRKGTVVSEGVVPLTSLEADYTLPATWLWVSLGDLVIQMDAGWSPQCENGPRTEVSKWGVLKTTAVQPLAFDARQHKELPARLVPRPEFEAHVGDILVTRAGPKNRVGVCCTVDRTEPRLMISDKLIRVRLFEGLSSRFFALVLNAGFSRDRLEDSKSGMAVMQMNISQDKLRAIPVPLPPLAEQHRIVAKVDELMAVCDRLETSIADAEAGRSRLLNALLQDALTSSVRAEAA